MKVIEKGGLMMLSTYQDNLIQLASNNYFETERFYLKPISLSDLLEYHELTSDDEALKYDYPAHQNLEESLWMMVRWQLSNPLGKYGIYMKTTGKLVGNISLTLSEEEAVARIGYAVNPNYWRQGIAFECLMVISTFAMKQLTLDKLLAEVHEENQPSIKLLEKSGFREIASKTASSLRYPSFIEKTYARFS